MRIRQTSVYIVYILMVSGMLLFAGTSQAQIAGNGNTGAISGLTNAGAASHGVPGPSISPPSMGNEMNRGFPAQSMGEVQLGMPNAGRSSSGSYDPFGNMATSGSVEPFSRMETPGGLGAQGNIGSPGSMGSPNGMGSAGGVIGGP